MPDTKNVTKQVQSVSPYNPSINSSLLQNNVDTSLNGTPSTIQKISEVELNTKDFGDINQSQKQDGFFVSITDKTPIYSISPEVLAQNDIKKLEEEIGVPYTFLSRTVAQQKAAQVKNDFLPKNRTFSLSEESTSSRIDTIDAELGYDRDGNRVYRKNVNMKWDYISQMKGYNTHRGTYKDIGGDVVQKELGISYSVIIKESREGTRSYEEISKGARFSNSIVEIKVLSNVQNYSFGTSQSFDPVEPRGSQSPLYFYKNNTGRTLGFTAEFYQQEYPTEPLLCIAEKAQYLARPYRHGDYAVIPKLVQVIIPGTTFRGYLTNVSVTYSADMGDYRNWDRNKVVEALDASRIGTLNTNDKINIETKLSGLVGGTYNQNKETMNYGLGKMSIDFTLAIVEEIQLTLYETEAEVQAKEDALRYENEQQQNRKEIEDHLAEARQFLYTYHYGISPSYLILVDENGKYVQNIYNPQDGTIMDQQDWPPGCVTLAEYEQAQGMKKGNEMNNKQSPNAPFNTDKEEIEDNLGEYSKEYLIDRLIKEKKENDPDITEEQEKQLREEYRNKSMEQVAEEYKKDVLSKECNDEEKSKFLLQNTSVQGGTLQISMSAALRQFLTKPINTIKDAQDVLNLLGTGDGWAFDAEIDLQQIEDYGVDDRWDWKIIVEICCEAGLALNMDWGGSHKNKYGIGYAGQGVATTGNCGFVIDDRFAFSSDPKKDANYKKKFAEGSTSVSRETSKRIWTFQRICTDWPANDFIIDTDEKGNKLHTVDTTIRDHVVMSIKAVRDAFYKGFNKLCAEKVTEKGAKLFNNEDDCKKYMKESGVSISYYWEYDGPSNKK